MVKSNSFKRDRNQRLCREKTQIYKANGTKTECLHLLRPPLFQTNGTLNSMKSGSRSLECQTKGISLLQAFERDLRWLRSF